MTDRYGIADRLIAEEGLRLKPYRDTVGKLTIGVGRNLDDVGISEDEARLLLEHDIDRAANQLDVALPWFVSLDAVRQAVLIDMNFNMGLGGLLSFHNTLTFMRQGNWAQAAAGMRNSLWARQVGKRAENLAVAMESGSFPAG
jgi:lysozyme